MVDEVREVSPENFRTDRRRELSRLRGDEKKRRIAFVLIGIGLLIMVGILIAGYTIIFVMPPRELVVRVGEVEYSRGDMVKLLRVRQKSTEFLGRSFSAGTDIFQALNLIVENEVIAQAAPRLGLSVPDEEVDANIQRLMGNTPTESQGKTADQIEREFKERYGSYLNSIQLGESEHRQLVRRTMLREKFRQFIGDNVPSVTEHVRLYRLTVSPDDEIDIMQIKYNDMVGVTGDSQIYQQAFFNLTREFSRESPERVRRGGDLGWVPQGIFQDYDDIIFNLDPGELSRPTTNIDGPRQLFVFMVSEKTDARELSEGNRDTLKTNALQDWLNEERRDKDVYAIFNSDIYNWMIKELGLSATITPTPRPDPFQRLFGN